MKRLQAFKFELMPNGEQARAMRRFAGACRFVFNKALALQIANYESGNKFIGYEDMAKLMTQWRNCTETSWLKDAPVHPLQHALKDLDRAYQSFFKKRAMFPRFKRKGSTQSFRYPDAKQFELDQTNSRIKLPKLGWVHYRKSRDSLGTPKNITISNSGGKWFTSIQTEREADAPIHARPDTAIGIDLGARLSGAFASFSDDTQISTVNAYRAAQCRLKRYQRAFSRKKSRSKNQAKACAKLNKAHASVAHIRKDFLHQLSTQLVQLHSIIAIENLKVKEMTATPSSPRLKNKAILD